MMTLCGAANRYIEGYLLCGRHSRHSRQYAVHTLLHIGLIKLFNSYNIWMKSDRMSETRRTEYEMNKWMEYVIAAMQRLCAFDMTWCDRWHFFFVYARQFGSELLMILCCCVKIICVCAHRPSPSSQYTAHRNGNVLNVHLMFARHSNRNEIKSQWKKKLYIKLLNNFIRLASEWARARETLRTGAVARLCRIDRNSI